MASNYKELPSALPAKEAKLYSKGIELVNDFVDGLRRQGLLPERFTTILKQPRLQEIQTSVEFTATATIVTDRERMATALGLTLEQIAQHPDEVNDKTEAYLGSFVNYDDKHKIIPVFPRIGHLYHIYTDYPKVHIPDIDLAIGGVPKEKLLQLVKDMGNQISSNAEDMLRSSNFTTIAEGQMIRLFKAPITALGFHRGATIKEVYARIDELGADLCPAEVGPDLRIQDTNQPTNDWYCIAMKQVAGSDGDPHVFLLARRESTWLSSISAGSDSEWSPGSRFVFSIRK
ncbi:MAG: hypothetical protein G01um10145_707 [Microgenomates group bacterium Gr01-1014_5]|nr:MAG: hypothetical protein G01um10145_707 [Microgenomates group bacterium Gr01-1014_5]